MILRKYALDHGGEALHKDTWPLEAYHIFSFHKCAYTKDKMCIYRREISLCAFMKGKNAHIWKPKDKWNYELGNYDLEL